MQWRSVDRMKKQIVDRKEGVAHATLSDKSARLSMSDLKVNPFLLGVLSAATPVIQLFANTISKVDFSRSLRVDLSTATAGSKNDMALYLLMRMTKTRISSSRFSYVRMSDVIKLSRSRTIPTSLSLTHQFCLHSLVTLTLSLFSSDFSLIQVVCLIFAVIVLVLSFFSTYAFQAGLVELLYDRFGLTLFISVVYLLLTIALNIWTLTSRWDKPLQFVWPTGLLALFVTQRLSEST
uniref:Transmembrane protein 138 n=1 Tax=Timema shepardi TaxID=629360 RepID=A0A7R9G4L3_TIMSH|nr:unnamed protein product [Timema shepardi]